MGRLLRVCTVGLVCAAVTPAAVAAPAQPLIVRSGPPAALAAPDPAGPEPATAWAAGSLSTRLDALGSLVATTSADVTGVAAGATGSNATMDTVTVTDERSGPSLAMTYPGRHVAAIRLLRGPRGSDATQLAIEHCAPNAHHTARAGECTNELLTVALGATPTVTSRRRGAIATAAAAGLVDHGRQLTMVRRGRGKVASCRSSFVIRSFRGRTIRHLGRPPAHDRDYPTCYGPRPVLLRGRWALASVGREDENEAWELQVWAIDLAAGRHARWHFLAQADRGTEGSGGGGLTGLGLLGDVAVWQATEWTGWDDDQARGWLTDPARPDTSTAPSLTLTDLPIDRRGDRRARPLLTPIAVPAVVGSIAASDNAIYLSTSQGVLRIVPARAA